MPSPTPARSRCAEATLQPQGRRLDQLPRLPLKDVSALGCAPSGPQFATTEKVKTPLDPRYNPFDWETWHELDVFRQEAEAKLDSR